MRRAIMSEPELDMRCLRKPDKHPAIFQVYDALPVGGSLVLVNNHDPRHLREESDADHPGSYGWDYLGTGPGEWRIRISKLGSTPLPRILADVGAVTAEVHAQDAAGAVWKLQMRQRDLDSNIICLQPGTSIDARPRCTADSPGRRRPAHHRAQRARTPPRSARLAAPPLPAAIHRRPGRLSYVTIHRRRQSLVLDETRKA